MLGAIGALLFSPPLSPPAQAAATKQTQLRSASAAHGKPRAPVTRLTTLAAKPGQGSAGMLPPRGGKFAKGRALAGAGRFGGGLQCVPFARSESGIQVSGNAHQWWENAAGLYARGSRPEPGSVLSFQSNGAMRLGHVAVVRRVLSPRHIEIDHANWAGPGGRKGMVARNVAVVDVSEANDWTAVRVELGQTGTFGSIYPTDGFIYARAEQAGTAYAAATPPARVAPALELGPAPRDLRPSGESARVLASTAGTGQAGYASVTFAATFEEVAEAAPVKRPASRPAKRRAIRR
jgi:hypothetical protein